MDDNQYPRSRARALDGALASIAPVTGLETGLADQMYASGWSVGEIVGEIKRQRIEAAQRLEAEAVGKFMKDVMASASRDPRAGPGPTPPRP